jgi:hypothetical protein
MKAASRPATLDKGKHNVFVAPSRLGFRLAFKTTDEGFVGLYNLALTAHWSHAKRAHGLAQSVRHEPSRLIGHFERPM